MYNDLNEIGSNFFKNKKQEEKPVDLTPHYTLTKVSSNNYHLFNAETRSGETLNRAEVLHRVASINGSSELSTENIKALDSLSNFDSVIIPTSALQLRIKASFDTMSVDPWKLIEVNGTKYFVINTEELEPIEAKASTKHKKVRGINIKAYDEPGWIGMTPEEYYGRPEPDEYSFTLVTDSGLRAELSFLMDPELTNPGWGADIHFINDVVIDFYFKNKKIGVYEEDERMDTDEDAAITNILEDGLNYLKETCTDQALLDLLSHTSEGDFYEIENTPPNIKASIKYHLNKQAANQRGGINIKASLHRPTSYTVVAHTRGITESGLVAKACDCCCTGTEDNRYVNLSFDMNEPNKLSFNINFTGTPEELLEFLQEQVKKMGVYLPNSAFDVYPNGDQSCTGHQVFPQTKVTQQRDAVYIVETPESSKISASPSLETLKVYAKAHYNNYVIKDKDLNIVASHLDNKDDRQSFSSMLSDTLMQLHRTAADEENINVQNQAGEKLELDINQENPEESILTKKDTGEQFQSTGDPNTPFTGTQGEKVKITDNSGQPKKIDELGGLPKKDLKLQIENQDGNIQQYDEEDF